MTSGRETRVLSVIGSLAVGGAETYLLRIATEIAKFGVEMEICALERKGPMLEQMEQAGIRVHGTPYAKRAEGSNTLALLRTVQAVRQIVRAGRFDVVQTYLYWSDVLGVTGAKLAGCRRIIVSRRALHRWIHSRGRALHGLEQFTNVLADEMIANSKTVLQDAEANERFLPATRTVIYNGVDVDRYTPATRSASGPLRLVTVGALAPRKGQEFAVRALARLRGSGLEATLRLIGSGPDKPRLRKLVADSGLDGLVLFDGELSDPRPALECADVFVVPSRQEGFSNAILEAMACGLPVVATDVGGNAEAIVDGEGGFIVPPEDDDALARGIAALAKERGRVDEMGRYNRRRVAERFSLNESARQLADWYLRGGVRAGA